MAKGKNFGLYFDGGTDIEIGSAEDLQLSDTSFTVEVWVKIDQYILSNSNRDTAILGTNERSGPISSLLHLTIRNKRPYIGFFHNDTAGNQIIEEKIWYHLAFVYNKRKRQQLIYVNGKLDVDSTTLGNELNEKSPFIGKGRIVLGNCLNLNSYMLGNMKGLRIWNSALSEDRISDNMKNESVIKEPGLTAYWTFEDGFVNCSLEGAHDEEGTSELEELNIKLEKVEANNRELLIKLENKNKEKEELNGLLEEKNFEISRLAEKVDREISDKSGVTIANLIADANKQIEDARSILLKQGSDYNLGHINLQFKMIPSETGDSVIFPSTEQIADSSGSLSTIDIEFAPKEATKVVEVPTKEVPDVTGLTEVMARRKIANAGFMTELKYQAFKADENSDQNKKDRVIKQIPDPGKNPLAEVNSTILIFIGKEIT